MWPVLQFILTLCVCFNLNGYDCWLVSLVRRDHVRNWVGMASCPVSMNGSFQLRNLMACGKGLSATSIFSWKFEISFYIDVGICFCSLIYESGLKQRLLRYAASALFFTEKGVDPFLVSWNRYGTSSWLSIKKYHFIPKREVSFFSLGASQVFLELL